MFSRCNHVSTLKPSKSDHQNSTALSSFVHTIRAVRRGISRQLQRTASESTPHDRVTVLQICSPCSLPLERPQRSTLGFPAGVSNRPTVHHVRRAPLIHRPLHRGTAFWIGSIQISQLARGAQIPIGPAAPAYVTSARFPPLEAFGRRPPNTRRPSSGRRPRPFTTTD